MEFKQVAYYKSPIGTAKIIGDEHGISSISILDEEVPISNKTPSHLINCVHQLDAYFSGNLTEFTVKLNPNGTDFQQKVWRELLTIPFGKTATYTEQTKKIGDLKAIRAVATANGKNPIWILIPCHRIIGSDGSLTGYAGGLWRKKWLLEHENPNKQQSLF